MDIQTEGRGIRETRVDDSTQRVLRSMNSYQNSFLRLYDNNINQRNAFYIALMAFHMHLTKFSVFLIAKRQAQITGNCFNDKDNSAVILQVLRY